MYRRTKQLLVEPIGVDVFNVPRHLLSKLDSLISFDIGCSLTKIAYVPKSAVGESESETLPLTCALFLNKDLDVGLEWVKDKAHLPTCGVMHVTGAQAMKHKDMVEKILGLKIQFIEESAAQIQGLKFLVNNLPIEEICYPKVDYHFNEEVQKTEMMEKILEKFHESMVEEKQEKSPKWPALFVLIGSAAGIININMEQKYKLVGEIPFAGKPFMGLARLLLGTCNYNEILELAESGKRENIDTVVKEIMDNDPDSLYGSYPPDMSIFNFGKALDFDRNLETFNRSDIATSLVSLCANNIISSVMIGATATKTQRVFIGGNLFRGEIFRKEVDRVLNLFGDLLQLHYLKSGCTGAIGTMLTEPGSEMTLLDI